MARRRSFGYIRKLPSGKYQASYIGPDKSRYAAPRTFLAKVDASQWLTKVEASLIDGHWESPDQVVAAAAHSVDQTFEPYARRHVDIQTNSRGEALRASTKSHYLRLLRIHLTSFHAKNLNEISTSSVSEWWARSSGSGKLSTTSKAYKLLSVVLNRAVAEGHIDSNPCRVKGAHSAATGKDVHVPTLEDIELLADNMSIQFATMVRLMAYSGLRFGEVIALRRQDLTSQRRRGVTTYSLRVNKAITFVDGRHIEGTTKSRASKRIVVVSSKISPVISHYLEQEVGQASTALLFPSPTDKSRFLRHDVFAKAWDRAMTRAEIEVRFTPHGLRHFAGSSFARAGGNLAELKAWLGDSSTSAVMRYVHDTGRASDLVERM